MRTPFMIGRYDPSQNLTRALVAEERTPQVIPGPWRMVALVRGEDSSPGEVSSPGVASGDRTQRV